MGGRMIDLGMNERAWALADRSDVAVRVVRSLEEIRAVLYVQRAVDHSGRDVRVYVLEVNGIPGWQGRNKPPRPAAELPV